MTSILVSVLLLLVGPAPAPTAAASDGVDKLVGDWQGALDTGAGKLHLAVHLAKNADGTLKASLDSLDQGATGIPVKTATFTEGKLRLDLPEIGAHYEGALATGRSVITGTWTQGDGSLPLELTKGSAPAAPAADKPSPSDPIRPLWLGTLDAGGTQLRLLVHLTPSADGALSASVDSLDQGGAKMPVDRALYKGGKLTLDLKQVGARFEGTANAEGTELAGRWLQGGAALPLTLKAIDKAP